jgi:twitching motility two-component system response regulator PilH
LARRILLADDSVTAQNMGRRILSDAGYEVVTVNNGSAALKKIAESRPDIIVLDVYMPGYGGLEVCQRVKEAAETARIPVLLTVGKLEPFKPEEARRAGADAFIVKPFEATELLTALTKLEDKIVAGPQPQKSGRFAKALAAVEQSAGERFGDKETGWKNRLTIPGPNLKPQSEPEAPETIARRARDFEGGETAPPVQAKQGFERPMPAGLPADITPEEIAAITAAAAAFGGTAGQPTVIPEGSASNSAASMQAASEETSAVQSSEPEAPPATLASATELEPAAPEVAAEPTPAAAETISEAAASSEAPKMEEPAAAEVPAAAASETDSAPQAASEAQVHEAEKPASRDSEVMAAIASLAPSNGHGSESVSSASTAIGTDGGSTAVANSLAAADAGITGPRWIAELVAVTLEESAPTLEQEMEQAAAARVTAEATHNDFAAAAAVEAQTPAPVVDAAETASVTDAVAAAESVPDPVVVAESVVAENVTADRAPVQTGEPDVPKQESASAFAAAAAAGSLSERVPTVEAVSSTTVSPEISESAPVASVEAAPQREAELAAAWQNWKQIRESFDSAQPPVAEAPAETSTTPEEPEANAKSEEAETEIAEVESAPSDAPGESTAIASIVDTMLAELRPKLVEEIAKKMSSEKKEKEREKEKKKRK